MADSSDAPEEAVPTYEIEGEEGEGDSASVPASTSEQEEEEREEEVVDDMGVPLFADRANRKLHVDILDLEKKLEAAQDELADHEERQRAMSEHVKSVEQEFRHSQQLLDAKKRELRTEKHMQQLAERDAGRIRTEIGRCDGNKEDIQSQISTVQNEIFKGNDAMDKYRLNMNFNQEELEQWTLAMKQNEDDQTAFERYMKVDDAKAKELTLQIEKLTQELQDARKALDEEVTETQAKQIELDKTAEEFRQRHRERQDVLRQWQDAVGQVKAREGDIQRAGETYAAAKTDVQRAQKALEAEKARLSSLKADCADMEAKSMLVDRVVQKKRTEEMEAKEKTDNFRAEVDLLKTEVAKASNEVHMERQKVVNAKLAIEETKAKIEEARVRLQQSKARLEEAKGASSSAELSAGAAQEALKAREAELRGMEQTVTTLKDQMFKESEGLFQFRQREANLLAELSGAHATAKNRAHEIQRLDDESLRQKELVYSADFQLQQLERRVARANGVRSDDEKKVLNKRIAQCQAELEAAQGQHKMLLTQLKNLEDELNKCKRAAVKTKKERVELAARLDELKLENTSAEATLEGVMKDKEDVMVSHDLMKLQVKGLADTLSDRADKVFGLENRKFQLEMSMQERKKQLQVRIDDQAAKAKLAEEERHKVALEAKECKLRVGKLEKKFATISKNPIGEDGQERSQAYHVIAASQKREGLQRERDELRAKIVKATGEMGALEATLANIIDGNTRAKEGSKRVNKTSAEAREFKVAYREAKAVRDSAFKKKKQLQRLTNELDEEKRRIQQFNEQARVADQNKRHLETTNNQLRADRAEQALLLDRAKEKVREHAQHHRTALFGLPGDVESVHETLFKMEINNQTRDSVLQTLRQLADEFPVLEPYVDSQFGLNLATAPPQTPL